MTSGFTTIGRDFTSALESSGWLAPFGVMAGDRIGDYLIAAVGSAWRALDRDSLADMVVRVIVTRTDDSIDVRMGVVR